MDSKQFFLSLYRQLETVTPLTFDCGRLCGRACCEVTPALPGMYLFPGEEALFEGVEGFTITAAELPGWGPVALLSCDGACERTLRPLACRVFPLAPKAVGDGVSIRMDARGRAVCPLCHQGRGALSGAFVEGVQAVFDALWARPEQRRFLQALSNAVAEYEKPLL